MNLDLDGQIWIEIWRKARPAEMEVEGWVPQKGQNNCVDTREYKVFESLWAEQLAGVMYLFKGNMIKRETVGTQHWDWIKKGLAWTKVGLDSIN